MEKIDTKFPELEDEERIIIPRESFESTSQEYSKDELHDLIQTNLVLPERACMENEKTDLAQKLGYLLVEEEYIKGMGVKEDGWEFEYDGEKKTIFVSEQEMPLDIWRDYMFRKQMEGKDGEKHSFFPMHPMYSRNGDEREIYAYRFLYAIGSAYQEYLRDKESTEFAIGSEEYYDEAVKESIDTPFAKLFNYCYKKRRKSSEKDLIPRGLSAWGNIEKYNSEENEGVQNKNSEFAIRALKDTNEFIAMYLWNPKYFEAYADYLVENWKVNLYKKGLLKIGEEEGEFIKNSVRSLLEPKDF